MNACFLNLNRMNGRPFNVTKSAHVFQIGYLSPLFPRIDKTPRNPLRPLLLKNAAFSNAKFFDLNGHRSPLLNCMNYRPFTSFAAMVTLFGSRERSRSRFSQIPQSAHALSGRAQKMKSHRPDLIFDNLAPFEWTAPFRSRRFTLAMFITPHGMQP